MTYHHWESGFSVSISRQRYKNRQITNCSHDEAHTIDRENGHGLSRHVQIILLRRIWIPGDISQVIHRGKFGPSERKKKSSLFFLHNNDDNNDKKKKKLFSKISRSTAIISFFLSCKRLIFLFFPFFLGRELGFLELINA